MQKSTKRIVIKPLIKQRFHLRGTSSYKECLIKRPKNVLNVDCSSYEKPCGRISPVQVKIQKALQLLKPVKRVSFNQFPVLNSQKSQPVMFSFMKRVSRVPTLALSENAGFRGYQISKRAKWVKFLPQLHNLTFPFNMYETTERSKDPLRYLRYCPKIQSLDIVIKEPYGQVLKLFNFQRYPKSLKRIFLRVGLGEDRQEDENSVIPFHRFKHLETACLSFGENFIHRCSNASVYDTKSCEFMVRNIHELSKCSNLRELLLKFHASFSPPIHALMEKISQKKTLKKLAFTCIYHSPDFRVLQILKNFDQLTHFKISADIKNSDYIREIIQSLQNMKQLQYLNIQRLSFKESNASSELESLYQQINGFHSLRHLNLNFDGCRNFVPSLCQALTKLETLSISNNSDDPLQIISGLADISQQNSTTSLRSLELNFTAYTPDKQGEDAVIRLVNSLPNLQVFSLPNHVIKCQRYLKKINKAIHSLKYLRKLTFGEITKKAITPSLIENLLSKRGLSSLYCIIYDAPKMNVKSIFRKNPFLEDCSWLSSRENFYYRLPEIEIWDSHN